MRNWAEISTSAIIHNLEYLKSLTNKSIMAVVKADGYGHGACTMANIWNICGIDYLAVATAQEALQLRDNKCAIPILVLGYVEPELVETLAYHDVSLTVYDAEQAEVYAENTSKPITIHIKYDSGLSRLGFSDALEIAEVCGNPMFEAEGIFTHFACADCENNDFTAVQQENFQNVLKTLTNFRINFKYIHCENSGAVLNYTDILGGNMVRVGIMLYGWDPSGKENTNLTPVMRWCCGIAQIKTLRAGDTISYGRTYTAERDMRVAVLPCGYADGYHRKISNTGHVLIKNQKAPICGRVCMDMMMVDITQIPCVTTKDTAVLFGKDGESFLSVNQLADWADTISYELLCSVGMRVPRIIVP